jgi:hypothetical protein
MFTRYPVVQPTADQATWTALAAESGRETTRRQGFLGEMPSQPLGRGLAVEIAGFVLAVVAGAAGLTAVVVVPGTVLSAQAGDDDTMMGEPRTVNDAAPTPNVRCQLPFMRPPRRRRSAHLTRVT